MKKGFSLIEIIVIMAIIVIMSSIIISDYNKQKNKKMLLYAVRQIAEDLRMAQNMTVDTLKFNGAVPQGGYGIKFALADNDFYIIFADINGDKIYNAGADGVVKTADLPKNIIIDTIDKDAVSIGAANVVFVPPYGDIYIDALNSGAGIIVLSIRLKEASSACPSDFCKVFEFNSEGKITK